MSGLLIAKDLALPVDAVTQKTAFLGRTGSGKTYGATKLAELMLDANAQIVALDPVGVWYGLRLDKNGKDPGFEIPIFGGLHGDIPLAPTGGSLVADLIVDRRLSAILDVSQFETDADKARFAGDFANRFFFRKKASPSAVHLFIEECQEFVPQNPGRGEEHMLHYFHRLVKLGRNFGIGVSLISQRPQEVNKKALNQTECMFAFQMTGPQERKAISLWVSEKGADEDVADVLPKLGIGEPHVWSPQWLGISRTVKIAPKRTFNASSTPTVGSVAVEARPLGAIDLEKLEKAMASTIEKAKAEDPKELRKRIAQLTTELNKKEKGGAVRVVEKTITDQAAIDAALRRGQIAAQSAFVKTHRDAAKSMRGIIEQLEKVGHLINGSIAPGLKFMLSMFEEVRASEPEKEKATTKPSVRAVATAVRLDTERSPASSTLSGLHRRAIDALAELQSIGIDAPSREQLAFYLGVAASGGYTSRIIGELKTNGQIDYPQPGYVSLTNEGRSLAVAVEPPSSLSEFHARVRRHLSGLHEKIFDVLVEAHPEAFTRDELAAKVNTTAEGGYFSRIVGELKTAGIVEYPEKGSVRASDTLFPDALI